MIRAEQWAALVEKIVDAIDEGLGGGWGYSCYGGNERIHMADALSAAATAAITVAEPLLRAEALEEAAKVAEAGYFSGEQCAAAIRALISEDK